EQRAEELALSAAEVEHAPRAALPQGRQHRSQPFLVERPLALPLRLLRCSVAPGLLLRLERLPRFVLEPRQRQPREAGLPPQVAEGDGLLFGMVAEPPLPLAEEVLHLSLADEVVLE